MPRKTKPLHQKFHDEIEKLLKNAGFIIEKSSYTAPGADIIASAEGDRIIVQCKSTEKENEIFSGLEDLVNSYSKRAEKEGTLVSILAFKNYKLPSKYYEEEKINELLEDRVVIWCNKDIQYYKEVVKGVKEWSRFLILGELGRKKRFGKPAHAPAFKVEQNGTEFCLFTISPENLLKIANVFRRKKDIKSYQRMLNSHRLRHDIRDYLDNKDKQHKPLFPTNLVCVFKNRIARFDEKAGKLKIPMKPSSVYLIDGQHRLYGFCHVEDERKRKDFDLVCAGFNIVKLRKSSLGLNDQADMFVTINERAKGFLQNY